MQFAAAPHSLQRCPRAPAACQHARRLAVVSEAGADDLAISVRGAHLTFRGRGATKEVHARAARGPPAPSSPPYLHCRWGLSAPPLQPSAGAAGRGPGGAARLAPHPARRQRLRQVHAAPRAGGAHRAGQRRRRRGSPLWHGLPEPRPPGRDAHRGRRRRLWAGQVGPSGWVGEGGRVGKGGAEEGRAHAAALAESCAMRNPSCRSCSPSPWLHGANGNDHNVAPPVPPPGRRRYQLSSEAAAAAARDALAQVGLAALADRPTSSLSGGQKQRVAIAGALAEHPRVREGEQAARPSLARASLPEAVAFPIQPQSSQGIPAVVAVAPTLTS